MFPIIEDAFPAASRHSLIQRDFFHSGICIAQQHCVSTMHLNGKPRVMVVDDDPSMRTFLEAFLKARGYCPQPVDTAQDAVPRSQADPPPAVILDMVLPGEMDGLDALAAFKKIDH